MTPKMPGEPRPMVAANNVSIARDLVQAYNREYIRVNNTFNYRWHETVKSAFYDHLSEIHNHRTELQAFIDGVFQGEIDALTHKLSEDLYRTWRLWHELWNQERWKLSRFQPKTTQCLWERIEGSGTVDWSASSKVEMEVSVGPKGEKVEDDETAESSQADPAAETNSSALINAFESTQHDG